MTSAETPATGNGEPARGPVGPSGLLDELGMASVVVDTAGRIVLWSPQAEELFGYPAHEALGAYAARLMIHEIHHDLVVKLFADVMETGQSWAGAFPIRHRDGSTRLVEFRNMRLLDDQGETYALGLCADQETVRRLERDVALSARIVSQSPIGLAVLDTGLRYVSVNPALERINGIPARDHLGRKVREVLPGLDTRGLRAAAREVLRTGFPAVDLSAVGRTPADPEVDHAWSVSLYRLEDATGTVLGVAVSVVDVTEQHRANAEAEAARRRLALIADASARIGTTLELNRTARELAEVAVPELADIASVDLLEAVVNGRRSVLGPGEPAAVRTLAVRGWGTDTEDSADGAAETGARGAAGSKEDTTDARGAGGGAGHTDGTDASGTAGGPGRTGAPGPVARYAPEHAVTECVRTGSPVVVRRVRKRDLSRIARSPGADGPPADPRVHSYLAVPLIARGEVLGALDLRRTRDPRPFSDDDLLLARELAARAAVQIDNARWYQSARTTALTLQRSLLPGRPPETKGLEVAFRYQPAGATTEVGGDWFDVIPLEADKTALVVGDVMGSGIDAAAAMGRLRTATTTLAALDLEPDAVLAHLDRITSGLDQSIATCVYAVHDPHLGRCRIANAGHLPPVRIRPGRPPELLDLPTGAPLGVGGVAFSTTTVDVVPGDRLVFYTDGLVETRRDPLDERLDRLLSLLEGPARGLEEICDLLLRTLHEPDNHDDVALLIAQVQQLP
ncbi:SpoIIE family protein phosphatase [Streptomyces mangrovisoli]|uniref:SpoIIE family protein phosphatase n=1 Tax=Streptomyces mangrovisoli TaxID=1428628 RepID=UPI001F0B6DD9|nr:SpoIIE family protein phosphatase [Streptomyces mangrovisoli]